MNQELLNSCTILKVVTGSHAYGFSTPESDLDIRGICIPSKEYFLSMDTRMEQVEDKVNDVVIYNVMKYFQLATANNPNIIEIMYIDKPEHILTTTKWGELIRENRGLFLSMKAKHTFSGYAYAQLKRIQTHKRWLMNPPTHKPTREEFGLNRDDTLSNVDLGSYNKLISEGMVLGEHVMEVVRRENSYQNANKEWNNYQEWLRTRNPKRAELEKKFGYDSKHASHLVRLMRMGYEILTQGKVVVERHDAEELKGIRNGSWKYDDIVQYAEDMDKKMQELYEHPEKCAVPYSVDKAKLNKLLMEIIEGYWKKEDNRCTCGRCNGLGIERMYEEDSK